MTEITRIVLEVEMLKQCNPPITDQQRLALVRMLDGTGKPLDEIVEMGKKVVATNTFGRTAFEYWVDQPKEEQNLTVRQDCRYCGSEWWGAADTRCPQCFGTASLLVNPSDNLPAVMMEIVGKLESKMDVKHG